MIPPRRYPRLVQVCSPTWFVTSTTMRVPVTSGSHFLADLAGVLFTWSSVSELKYWTDEEIFRRHFTRVARSGMRGFVEDPGPRDKALLLARRQWEYTYLLRYLFEGRQDFAGPDGNVLPCVGADSFLYTFVEMLLKHFRSFDVTPMAYAQRMDEEYAMARRKELKYSRLYSRRKSWPST